MAYDDLDRLLLNQLLDDGRASLRSLADDLDVSVTTVSNRLGELEEADAIESYEPYVNYDALGYDITAVVQLKLEGDAIPDVVSRLREQPRMRTVYEVTGDYDVIAVGKFRNTDEMDEQIKDLLTDTAIRESNTSVVLNTVAEGRPFELDPDAGETVD